MENWVKSTVNPIDFTLPKCYDEFVIEKGGDKAAAHW